MKQTVVTIVHFSCISSSEYDQILQGYSPYNVPWSRLPVAEREMRCFMVSELPCALKALQFLLLCIPCSVAIFVNLRVVRWRCHSTTDCKNVTSHLSCPVVPLTAAVSSSSSTFPKNSFWGDKSSWAGFFLYKWEAENTAWVLLSQIHTLNWALLTVSGER